MALEVYLESFMGGEPGGGDAGAALAILRAFGARRDDFGAWQLEFGEGAAAEVTGFERLDETAADNAQALSCLVRLSDLTPRGADFLFELAQNAVLAIIVPHEEAPNGVYVLVPMEVDPADLPAAPPFDTPRGVDHSGTLFALLNPLQAGRWSVWDDELNPRQRELEPSWTQRIMDWLRRR